MDTGERSRVLALALCPAVERATLRKLMAAFGSAQAVWDAPAEAWQARVGIRAATAARLDKWRRSFGDDDPDAWLQRRGLGAVVQGDPEYPVGLHELPDPPLVLFWRGQPEWLTHSHAIAIVGTRRASGYGLEAVTWIAEELARAGGLIVSGLAVGIDIAAHRAAIRAEAPTLAVMACGIDRCYPPSHARDMSQVMRHGLVVSEYPPGVLVDKHRFLERNRLIAALARAVVIVQAGERSGALRTADYALELGRDVYVVPGPITSVHFRGSHRLLYAGAQILVDPADLITDVGLSRAAVAASERQVPERWVELYESLHEPRTAVALAQWLQIPVSHVYAAVLELELAGWIERVPGGAYRRKR